MLEVCTGENCKINIDDVNTEFVKERIAQAIKTFDEMVNKTDTLEIDAYLEKGYPIAGKDHLTEEDGFKVINHKLETAFFVPLKKIVFAKQEELKNIITALSDGIFQRLEGITRIVGYYSRVSNWNKSKIGELRDRRVGNYWEKTRVNTAESAILKT
jgi:hypothetical protein